MNITKIIEYYTDNNHIDFENDVVVEFDGYNYRIAKWNLNGSDSEFPNNSKPTIEELNDFYLKNKITIDTIELNKQDIARIERLIDDAMKIRSDDNLRFALIAKKKYLIDQNNKLKDSVLR